MNPLESEERRHRSLLQQTPGFVGVLQGPEHEPSRDIEGAVTGIFLK